jgi:diketogulonate reductase-like aldo/keto reductase
MQIPSFRFGNGNSIPALGLGTWQLTGSKCENAVKIALELGYNHIDTAEAYGNQKEIGKAINGFGRKKLFITSKIWNDNLHFQGTINSCDKILKELGTDYLDLLLIHWPVKKIPFEETFRAFEELEKSGKAKSFGVSNFTIRHLEEALPKAKISIVNNQCEFHPYLFQKELLEYCNQHKIIFTAYSPLGRKEILDDKLIKEIAEKYSKTAAQVCLRWIFEKGIVVIPKASSEEHLKENMEIFGWELSKEDSQKIDSIQKNRRIINPFFGDFD